MSDGFSFRFSHRTASGGGTSSGTSSASSSLEGGKAFVCILNPAAGGGAAGGKVARFIDAWRSAFPNAAMVQTTRPGEAEELAFEAASGGKMAVAAGGDGTVHEVLNGVMRTAGVPGAKPLAPRMAVLPVGTGNDVARQVGVPTLDHAFAALASGRTRKVDVIRVSFPGREQESRHRHALLFAAAGFATDLVLHTTPFVKRWFGRRLCYSIGFFRAILSYRAPKMRFKADDAASSEGAMFHVCAGNAEYAGGGMMRLSPGASMSDGRLKLCWIPQLSRLEILRRFPSLLAGTHIRHPSVTYRDGIRLEIDCDPQVPLQLDGDIVGLTPATIQVLPAALEIACGGGG